MTVKPSYNSPVWLNPDHIQYEKHGKVKGHRTQTIGRRYPDQNSEILNTDVFLHAEQHLHETQSVIS